MTSPNGNITALPLLQPIDSPQDLGLALYRARKALGLTQADVALAAGVGLRFVVELEAGKTTIRLGKALQVLQVLGARLHMAGVPLADNLSWPQEA